MSHINHQPRRDQQARILLSAGFFYFVELMLGFHVGFIGTYNAQQRLIMDGPGIARYYFFRGSCFTDLLAVVAWVAQVSRTCFAASCHGY